jgi:hypothetical protein
VNSAVEHQTFGMRIHRMIEKAHPAGDIRQASATENSTTTGSGKNELSQ